MGAGREGNKKGVEQQTGRQKKAFTEDRFLNPEAGNRTPTLGSVSVQGNPCAGERPEGPTVA
jgi:hypothetical protein